MVLASYTHSDCFHFVYRLVWFPLMHVIKDIICLMVRSMDNFN